MASTIKKLRIKMFFELFSPVIPAYTEIDYHGNSKLSVSSNV